MSPEVDASPVPAGATRDGMVVFDTVYNPRETKLLKTAAEAGALCISGVEMFVRQAMAQYRVFVGQDADEDIIRRTMSERLR